MITAATVAMSAALAGFAFAASPSGPTATDDTSVVAPATTAGSTSTAHLPGVDDSDGRVGGGHGADDPAGHDPGHDPGHDSGHDSDSGPGSDDHGSDD